MERQAQSAALVADRNGQHERAVPISLDRARSIALCLAAIVAASVPIIISGGLFFVDGPNHLFRIGKLHPNVFGQVESPYFEGGGNIYPNMAIDVVTWLFTKVSSPELSLILFVCLALAAFIGAAVYWRASLGHASDACILLVLILVAYSEPLYWGLFNYIFGSGLMFVAVKRAIEQRVSRSSFFLVAQALIVGTMVLISIFPVMLYVAFCIGLALVVAYDGYRTRRFGELADLLRSHWLSALVTIVLVMLLEPGQTGHTSWHLPSKILSIVSVGKTTNVPFEYLTSAVLLCAMASLAWARGMEIGRHEVAGLVACCCLFLVMPKFLMSVGAADRRLVPAIVTMALVFVRGPSAATAKPETAVAAVLGGILVLKLALLLYVWAPLREESATYAAITPLIPAKAIVFFVPSVEHERPDAMERAARFVKLVANGRSVPVEESNTFVEHPHLLLRHLIGRDVLPAQVFTNFWLKRRSEFADLPDPATSQTLDEVMTAFAALPYGGVSYVVSHIELDAVLPHGASSRLIARSGRTALYTVTRSD